MTTNLQVDRPSSSSVPVLDRRMALALLGLLVLVGALAGVIRLLMGLGATTNLSDTYSWGIWIGFDFTLIAFAGAGFTIAALAHVLRQHQYHDAVRPAILAGFIGYVAVLLLLVLDLGRPDRFYNFLLFWNPHSPLFEVSWCILLYTTVLFIETSPFLLERLRLKRLLGLTGKIMLVVAIAGVTLSSLHQSTLGTLYLNMPYRLHALWFAPILPLLFFVSAVMAGLSMAVLTYVLATRIARREAKPEIVRGLATLAGWAGLIYLALKLGDLLFSGELSLIFNAGAYSAWWWIEVGIGLILPISLLFVPMLRKRPWVPVVAPILMLFGVLMNRFNATMFGQILPPGASYSPHLLEWLSTLGVLAAGVLAWVIGIRLLVIFDSKYDKHA